MSIKDKTNETIEIGKTLLPEFWVKDIMSQAFQMLIEKACKDFNIRLEEALIKADKQFDMLILPSQRHGYQGDHLKYFTKIRWNYFVKHLRGVEPIWKFDLE